MTPAVIAQARAGCDARVELLNHESLAMSEPLSSTAAPLSSPTAAAPPGRLALWVMLSGTFMVVLDFFIVNVALPSMQHELQASSGALQGVVIGYGVANAAFLVTGGRIGDMLGRRRAFLAGVALFTLASAACGLAPSAAVLVGARIAQGMAGALLQPQVLAMLGQLYAGAARAKAFAAYGLALGLGAASGQLVGGLLMHADLLGLGWRTCFLINLPLGALAIVLGRRVLPHLPGQRGSRLDLAGVALVVATLCTVIVPLVLGRERGWPAWSGAVLALAPVLAALLWRQQRALARAGGQPLVAPALTAQRPFVLGLGVTLLFFTGNASFYFVLALYLQQGLGLSPLAAGVTFTALASGFFGASMASPWLARRLGRGAIFAGALLLAAGHATLYALVAGPHAADPLAMSAVLLVQGAGLGLVMAPLAGTVLAGVPGAHAGVASGVMSTVQQVGNALGVALLGIVFYGAAGPRGDAAALAPAFGASLLCLSGVALAVAVAYRRFTRATTRAPSAAG